GIVDGVVGFSQLPAHWFLVEFGLFAVAEVVKRGYTMRAESERPGACHPVQHPERPVPAASVPTR
ncbi:hypothetical protein, partial [Actinophytocola sp.]|uniref:hypothetical protein n=1 Tax=Actinophytocola sp. TaxID=1872138 RepID=UPI002D8102EE